jgi:ankyrin repeat protein
MRKPFTIVVLLLLIAVVGCTGIESTEPAAVSQVANTPAPTDTSAPETAVPKPTSTSKPTDIPEPTSEPIEEAMTQEEMDEALFAAVRQDDVSATEALISAGANVNATEKLSRFTPIIIATLRNNPDTFMLLLEAGADASIIDKDQNTLLHHAASNDSLDVAAILLEKDIIDLEHKRTLYGLTPLHAAAEKGYLEMVELLIAYGADIEAEDDWNDTPLNIASYHGGFEVVKKLVELGAKPDVVNTQGKNALDYAQSQGHEDIEAFLLTVLEE